MGRLAKSLLRTFAHVFFNTKTVIVLLLLVIVTGAAATYFYFENQKTKEMLVNPAAASEREVKEVTAKVKNLMELPGNEAPTLITVVDKEKLKDQPFFSQAENGDKVLVYTEARKAILYRPSANKIVEVGPVEITPTATFKVAMYNGNGDPATLTAAENLLKEKVTNLEFTTKTNAKGVYQKTLVVDVNGDKKTEADQLAELLGGEVGPLPATEDKPDADFLIIVGK
ncbi:MAG: hypothetical protein BWY68_00857 [bacterium ADurb.Bin400]|nr:MAG: hypothetical protein BWY68_00857 [bacterium ADurb.Bin400]